jgi:hypothetical protein
MDGSTVPGNVTQAMAAVETIDLTNVMRKLRTEEGWDEAQAATAAMRYRRFLCMRYLGATFDLVPARDIDKVWHQHILHTRDYAEDCRRVFGDFVHHAPGKEDSETMLEHTRSNFEKTQARYAELFGEDYVETWLTYFLK